MMLSKFANSDCLLGSNVVAVNISKVIERYSETIFIVQLSRLSTELLTHLTIWKEFTVYKNDEIWQISRMEKTTIDTEAGMMWTFILYQTSFWWGSSEEQLLSSPTWEQMQISNFPGEKWYCTVWGACWVNELRISVHLMNNWSIIKVGNWSRLPVLLYYCI